MGKILSHEKSKGYLIGAKGVTTESLMFYDGPSGWVRHAEKSTVYTTLPEAFMILDEFFKLQAMDIEQFSRPILTDTIGVYETKELIQYVNPSDLLASNLLYDSAKAKLSAAELEALKTRVLFEQQEQATISAKPITRRGMYK